MRLVQIWSICALQNPHLVPAGWEGHRPPALASFLDISIYELHIRDFRRVWRLRVSLTGRPKHRAFCVTSRCLTPCYRCT